ncbi:MAG: glycogen/starch synthase [Caldisphaera sp.]
MFEKNLTVPRSIKRVWLISFEFFPIVKLGGLGQAVYQFAKALEKDNIEVTVLIPSHGRHLDLVTRAKYKLTPLDLTVCGERIGQDGNKYGYCLGAEEANFEDIRLVLFKGLDYSTGIVFDTWNVYSNVEEKSVLLARAARTFAWQEIPPDLVHVNDWHSLLAGISLRDELEKKGIAIPLVYSIHLSGSPNFPWHYASSNWAGLDDNVHKVWRVIKHEPIFYSNLWQSLNGNVEAFGVHVSDTISTVSRSYLNEELIKKYGNWIQGKSCVIYNSTDWNVNEVEKWIKQKYGVLDKEIIWDIINDYVQNSSWNGCEIKDTSKAIVLFAGRLTSQKGVDLAIKALDYAPSVNLIILGIPVGDIGYESYIKHLIDERKGRILISSSRIPEEPYRALFRLSSSLVVPSRWEPFGIVAVEALSQGTPVISSWAGGLKEIVDDIRGKDGNGILVKPESVEEIGLAMETLAHIMWDDNYEKIPIESIRNNAINNNLLSSMIRHNAINKVDKYFRIENQVSQLKSCYEKAREMAYFRTL